MKTSWLPRFLLSTTIATVGLSGFTALPSWAQDDREGRRGRGRGEFNIGEFIQRLDVNRNGQLEPEEMSGRTSRFIERLGIPTDQPIAVADLIKRAEAERNGEGSSGENGARSETPPAPPAAASNNVVRKVPGFGTAKSTTGGNVARFGATGATAGTGDLKQYSDAVREQVENALRRYDKNQNRLLESEEWKEGRWGAPSPEESDTNKDGNLSVDELAARYAQRDRAISDSSESNSGGSDSGSSRERGRRGQDESGDSQREESNSDRPSSREPSSSRGSSGGSSSDSEKTRDYVQQLVDKYDKDKDGRLSAEEFKEVRRPPANADADGDGFVTVSEYVDAMANAGSGGSTSGGESRNREESSASESPRNSRSTRSSSGNRGGGETESETPRRSSSSGRFEFFAADRNRDGQVQMSEFTSEWTAEKLREFRQLDANGDGVISAEEAGKK